MIIIISSSSNILIIGCLLNKLVSIVGFVNTRGSEGGMIRLATLEQLVILGACEGLALLVVLALLL